MNRFALLTLYRSLARHIPHVALNVCGLAVGIAVFLVLGLYVRGETKNEAWLPNYEQVYLVRTGWHVPGPDEGDWPSTMGGLLEELRTDFPNVAGARLAPRQAVVVRNGVGVGESMVKVDPDFLRVISLQIVSGQAQGALNDPSNLLIDQTTARKYFSGVDPIGQPLTATVGGVTTTYKVAAVFKDLPKATELGEFSLIAQLSPKVQDPLWYHWGMSTVATFLKFRSPADAQAFDDRLPAFVARHAIPDLGPNATKTVSLSLLPINELHLQLSGRKLTVTTLGIVGMLTLLIAIVNYANLATARAGVRAREVAMRKVLGATRANLMRQFLGEAVALTLLAAVVGLALTELGLPVVNAASGLSINTPYLEILPALALLALVVGIVAGLYPAALLSRIPAASVLAATDASGGRLGARIREGLVVFQFAFAIAFLVGTLVLVAQTQHVRKADLGYNRDSLVVVPSLANQSLSAGQRASLIAAFRELPAVRSMTIADTAAGDDSNILSYSIRIPDRPGKGPELQDVRVGPDFFSTYGARLIAGRAFNSNHGGDEASHTGDPHNVVINSLAASQLGFRSPSNAVSKIVRGPGGAALTIVGVVDNLRFYSPRSPLGGTYYEYMARGPDYAIATLRIAGDPRSAIQTLRRVWRSIAPETPFDAKTANSNLETYYAADDHAAWLLSIGSVLAVLIGCVGLWGLAAFNTGRRVKEIGIRKTLGATSVDIVSLLVGQFLRPVLLANLIAWPVAYFAMNKWLTGFDDRIALSPVYFVSATLIAVVVALLTVMTQSLRAARAAPAWALRHE